MFMFCRCLLGIVKNGVLSLEKGKLIWKSQTMLPGEEVMISARVSLIHPHCYHPNLTLTRKQITVDPNNVMKEDDTARYVGIDNLLHLTYTKIESHLLSHMHFLVYQFRT